VTDRPTDAAPVLDEPIVDAGALPSPAQASPVEAPPVADASGRPGAAHATGADTPSKGFTRIASALASRNFRLLWMANVLSTSGTWMQKVAQNWLVLTVGGSAFYLGLDAFLGELPILLLTLVGGVIADRHDRRRLLIGSQVVQLSCAFTLAALVYWDVIRIWHVLALSCTAGIAQAFGGPAYQSLLPSLVPKADLPNAIALNSIQFNLSRILGPLMAGVALAAVGMAACFALNGLSFFVVIGALLMVHVPWQPPATRRSLLDEMRTGLAYVRARPTLVELTLLGFLTTFLALPIQTLLPVMARETFGLEVGGYSRLMACSGAGAVLGALVIAWRGRSPHMGRHALIVGIGLGGLIVAFSASRVLAVSYALLLLVSIALIILTSTAVSLAQLIAPDDMRGRVMSIFMVAFRGGMPLGSLAASSLASATSAPIALAVCGVLITLVSAAFLTWGKGVRSL
jgi:MFS family permease